MTDAPASVQAPRLNPFSFPSDTDFRFVLLVVTVFGSSILVYFALYNRIPAYWERQQAEEQRCTQAALASHPSDSLADVLARNSAHTQCMEPSNRRRVVWVIGCVALLAGVAGLIYWLQPSWKIRRNRLVPISSDDVPEVVTYLEGLCREAGLAVAPIFVWNPLQPSANGLAFGRAGRYYVYLGAGLVVQFYTARPIFRALVLHELAHLQNRDVNKTYLAVAVWRAFVAVALVPFAATLTSGRAILGLGWRIAGLTALVYLMRNAVLRAREIYADVRASVWDGPDGGLQLALNELPEPKRGGWRGPLHVHPDPSRRHAAVADTYPLFRIGFWDAFGTGAAAGIVFENVAALFPSSLRFLDIFGAGLVLAPLVVGVVGLATWRSTFAALARGEMPKGAGRLGISTGLGITVGQALSLASYAASTSGLVATGSTLIVFDIVWTSLLLFSLFLFLRWIAAGASVWLEVAVKSDSPRPAYRVGLTVAGALLAIWLSLLFYVGSFRIAAHSVSLSSVYNYVTRDIGISVANGPAFFLLLAVSAVGLVLANPLTLLTFIVLWAYPLAAWFRRRKVGAAGGSSWALLDPSPQPLSLPPQPALRPDLALKVGAVSGLVWCILSAAAFGLLRVHEDGSATWALFGQAGLAALIQAYAAGRVTRRVNRLAWMHGLFAAFVGGVVMWVGAVGLTRVFLRGLPSGFAWVMLGEIINGGALLALLTALWISWWASRFSLGSQSGQKRPSGV